MGARARAARCIALGWPLRGGGGGGVRVQVNGIIELNIVTERYGVPTRTDNGTCKIFSR